MAAKLLVYGAQGGRVKALQMRLNDNPFFKPRRKIVIDGDMRTLTCGAVQQAKYRLGYPKASIKPVAGQPLFDYLSGKRKLSDAYRARRKARLAKQKEKQKEQSTQTKMRLKALAAIKGELGTMENPPHSNHIKYNTWWGWGAVAYCAIGIAWAWVKAGSTAFVKGSRWANTDAMLADAKAGRNGLHLTNDPDPGCPAVVDLDGTHTDPDHAITYVSDNGDGTFTSYEFNTVIGWMEGVLRKTRRFRDCWFFEVEC
jgi:hypothetical protein